MPLTATTPGSKEIVATLTRPDADLSNNKAMESTVVGPQCLAGPCCDANGFYKNSSSMCRCAVANCGRFPHTCPTYLYELLASKPACDAFACMLRPWALTKENFPKKLLVAQTGCKQYSR